MKYTCAACRQEFESTWSEDEANAEYLREFPFSAASDEPREVVCDDCYQQMTAEIPTERVVDELPYNAGSQAIHSHRRKMLSGLDPHNSPQISSVPSEDVAGKTVMSGAVPPSKPTHCTWREDEDGQWETECGGLWTFMADGPKENKAQYCIYCGGKLVLHHEVAGAVPPAEEPQ